MAAAPSTPGGQSAKTQDVEEEARQHLKDIEASGQVVFKSRQELIEGAKLHRDKNACTERDEAGNYKYKSCCGTGVSKLGVYGVGVSLYFQFLRQMGLVFFFCAIVLSANSAFNLMGNMVNETSALYKYLGMTTIGNLGACEGGRCETDEELRERCLFNQFPCETPLKDVTQWLGLADGLGILMVLAWGILFQVCHIPRVVQANDEAHITTPDFAVDITVLPYKLGDDHAQYEQKLKQHFISILQSLGIEDPSAVVEVCLVRNYDGAISTFLKKGNLILAQHGDIIRMKELEGKDDAASKKSLANLEKKSVKKYKEMKRIERSIKAQAEMSDEQRGVVRAFVTFSKASYRDKVLDHYRFSKFFTFRCCQNKDLRFEGSALKVQEACDPSDLYWENLDFPAWKRYCRVCFVILLTFVLLIICAAALVFFQSLSKSTLASVNEHLVWVVKSTNSSNTCLEFCDLEIYGDRLCTSNGDTSDSWPTVKLFDQFQDYSNGFESGCSNNWTSPCSSASLRSQHSGACGVSEATSSSNTDWIGFHFESKQQVQCWAATFPQMIQPTEVQVYGCPSAPPAAENRSCWVVEENCAPMYVNELFPSNPTTAWTANDNKVAPDTSCSNEISVDVAKARWASYSAGSDDRILNPIINCFCQQEALSQGPGFAFPPYDTEEKQICEAWILNNAAVVGKVIGAAMAVLVINQVLLLIYEYLVAFERHCTVTEVTLSQFWKLFLAQMVNTALLVLLVNASLEIPPVLQFLRVLQIGSGQFDELSVTWYVSVGTGICLTIFIQVFSTTIPPVIMAFFVKPCLACLVARGEVVEAKLNEMYVLPPWNLSLRMAQTLTVVFVICMYSGGMPLLYVVGFVYSIVAFWLDKWCLLKGSSKPPAYNQKILQVCLNFLPVAAFLHTVIAGWTYGNQALVPSEWSSLLFVAEMIFMSEEDYNSATAAYLSAPQRLKPDLQWKYYEARMMDMARQGSWLIFCIFLVFCVYYIVLWLYKLLLKPFISPILFALGDCCCKKKVQEDSATWETCLQECEKHNVLTSYALNKNTKYHAAAVAIAHGDDQAKKQALL